MSTPQHLIEIRRRTGRIWWEFYRENSQSQNIRHEIKAAECVTKTWLKDKKAFELESVKWSVEHAQAVCDRLDYEESVDGKKAAAQVQYDGAVDDEKRLKELKAKLVEDYPTITTVEVAK